MASIPNVTNNDSTKEDPVTKPGCVFCNVSEERDFKIVLRKGGLVVFKDRSPAAQEHLLVTPLNHIDNVKQLSAQHVSLIQEMEAAGHEALDKLSDAYPKDQRLMGFHIPPFSMINHLHLHAMVLPFKGFMGRILHSVSPGSDGHSKGWSIFVTSSQAIEILQKGRKIAVTAC